MATQPDISSILAALAAQRPASQNQTPQQQQQPPPQAVQGLPPGFANSLTNAAPPGFSLPQPSGSGSVDLSSIRPSNTGSVSIADAIAKARGFAAEKGYESGRASAASSRDDPRLARQPYRRSRSRSRSPPRRDNYRDSYNPYRDERRDDRRGGSFGRERSRSPAPRLARDTFSPPRQQYGRERSPETDSETIIIDSALVGLVIGRQGENLKRIEQDTKTRIQFITGPEAGGPRRQCRITGPLRARFEAKREINRIIEENGGNPPQDVNAAARVAAVAASRERSQKSDTPVLRDGENSLQIMVPDRTVGLIIGRGGETIRDLQERSGCHVNIVGENKSINGLRPVNLIGTPQAAQKAKDLILEIVESDTRAPNQPIEQSRGGGFDAFGGMGQGGSDKINETIMVPSEAVGMIIGKGGETIKDMQNSTGCKINVTQASGADIQREIGLIGTRQAIEEAKRAIWDKVDTVQQRERNGGKGGRGGRDNNDNYGDRYSQQQPSYVQQQAMPSQSGPVGAAPVAAAPSADGADPYAAWGGYHNYVAMWYAAIAQQQQGGQGQPGQPGQGEAPRPPGA